MWKSALTAAGWCGARAHAVKLSLPAAEARNRDLYPLSSSLRFWRPGAFSAHGRISQPQRSCVPLSANWLQTTRTSREVIPPLARPSLALARSILRRTALVDIPSSEAISLRRRPSSLRRRTSLSRGVSIALNTSSIRWLSRDWFGRSSARVCLNADSSNGQRLCGERTAIGLPSRQTCRPMTQRTPRRDTGKGPG